MSEPILIGLAGKARTGKDTAADYLHRRYNFDTYAFADPIKRAASEMFGIPLNDFYDDCLKEKINPFWGFSPRQIAQKLGTEGGRNLFREDIWLKRGQLVWEQLKEKIHKHYEMIEKFNPNCDSQNVIQKRMPAGLVITDVRFENEADMIRSQCGVIVHIHRKNAQTVSNHVSERGVEAKGGDIIIDNDGTINDFYENLHKIFD